MSLEYQNILQVLQISLTYSLLSETTMSYFFQNGKRLLTTSFVRQFTHCSTKTIDQTKVATITNTAQCSKTHVTITSVAAYGACHVEPVTAQRLAVNLITFLCCRKKCVWWFHIAELTLQTVKKTGNCCFKRTKHSALADKKRRYWRSGGIAELRCT